MRYLGIVSCCGGGEINVSSYAPVDEMFRETIHGQAGIGVLEHVRHLITEPFRGCEWMIFTGQFHLNDSQWLKPTPEQIDIEPDFVSMVGLAGFVDNSVAAEREPSFVLACTDRNIGFIIGEAIPVPFAGQFVGSLVIRHESAFSDSYRGTMTDSSVRLRD